MHLLSANDVLKSTAEREARLIEVIGELTTKIDEMNAKLAEIKQELVEIKNNTAGP